MSDILLIFPPQWSPFQPPLSLPSLSAWLRRAGFSVSGIDLNIQFYEWLLSDACANALLGVLNQRNLCDEEKMAFRSIISAAADFRGDITSIKAMPDAERREAPAAYVERNYRAVKAFESYLSAVSEILETFVISPYTFSLKSGELCSQTLERLIANPPEIIARFLRTFVDDHVVPARPATIGISCIGQEQLYFTLVLGALLKERTTTPVLVGGTILSRVFERGVLKKEWFARYFDIVVRNEGEKPCEKMLSNLRTGRLLTDAVPGIVYCDNDSIVSSPSCAPLKAEEIPIPDFDDLPLGRYFSANVTLPVLSSRGCYWGKCEFCHHGMVYGDKYGPYQVDLVHNTIRHLSQKYNAQHFAFNDEAIPPKLIRHMGQKFPPSTESGWSFTGLIKFEEYFRSDDFEGLARVGFRSLYVGLESASERVLSLMKKNNKRTTMRRNLADATRAGIWMHCFLFFGFPGETEEDAQETYDFIMSNADIIGSFGCGVFSLEHNAPIFKHLDEFGVRLRPSGRNDVDVYYAYDVANGIDCPRAEEWSNRLNEASLQIDRYHAVDWVPREHLLCLLSAMPPADLVELGLSLRGCGGLPRGATLRDVVTVSPDPNRRDAWIVVKRLSRGVLTVAGASGALIKLLYDQPVDLMTIASLAGSVVDRLAFPKDAR
ncbi:hypothetical protein BE21_00800 [Sorangium cellulosum]|uniref:Elp3/MiaA/NifB-like radical SAM core domain-containing protein n=1 Tax=Sorangium cellulosum TaxID=56 RepID=A0A150U3E3_SORCE|nr:hypothetical protein BE21_00800 [Sorangium cellulosum]